jgi:hypothetical protein
MQVLDGYFQTRQKATAILSKHSSLKVDRIHQFRCCLEDSKFHELYWVALASCYDQNFARHSAQKCLYLVCQSPSARYVNFTYSCRHLLILKVCFTAEMQMQIARIS